MSYLDKNYLSNEKLVYQTQLHWIIFIFPLIWLFLYFLIYQSGFSYHVITLFPYIIYIPLILFVGDTLRSYIRYKTTEFLITNKRLIIKEGFIRTNTSEYFLQKIENIQMNQSVLGRIFGYGTLIVHGTGGTRSSFFLIDNPTKFCAKVQEEVEKV